MQQITDNTTSLLKMKRQFYCKFLSERMIMLYTVIPFIILTFLFYYYPLFGWSYAFLDFQPGVPLLQQHFVGFANFVRMFEPGSGFIDAIKNTLVYSSLLIICAPLPIVFAIMLGEISNTRFSRIVQTVTSLPNFISWVLVFSISFALFSNEGFINTLLTQIGIIKDPMNILGNAHIVYWFQTGVTIWKTLGWSAIIYIAAMSGIDRELYNAAEVDGAGRFQKIFHVTVPGLMPTFIVLLLLSVSGMLNNQFEQYFVFRNPMVASRTDTLDIFAYMQGIGYGEYAYAAAIGIFKSVVSIILLFAVNLISKKVRGQSIV